MLRGASPAVVWSVGMGAAVELVKVSEQASTELAPSGHALKGTAVCARGCAGRSGIPMSSP